jgi:SET family sugar efflux transporter-like MFS transporter
MPAQAIAPPYRVIVPTAATLFLAGLASAATIPYAAIVAIEGLGISNPDYALILIFSSLVGMLSSVVVGWFSDHVRDRRLLVIASAALCVVGQVLVWAVHEPWAYVLSTCGIMALGGVLTSQLLAFARTCLMRQGGEVDFYMTLVRAAYSVSWVVGPPLAGWIAARYSVFDTFGLAALAFLLAMGLFLALLRVPETRLPPPRHDPEAPRAARGIAPYMLVGIVGIVALNTSQRLNGVATPLAIINHWQGNLGDVGLYAALAAFFEIPFMVAWGFVVRRVPVPIAIAIAAGLYALYLHLVGSVSTVGDLLWLQVLNGLSIGALLSLPISYMQEAIRGRVGLSTSLLDVVFVASGLISAGIFALATRDNLYLPIFAIGSWISWGGMAVMALAWWLERRARAR